MASHRWKAGGGALKKLLAGLLLIAPSPGAGFADAARQQADGLSGHIREASMRFGIPEHWIRSVIRAESGGRTTVGGRPIVSRAGAMGLMQLMPATWAEMRERHGLGSNPHDPRSNILAGTAYLRSMHDRFGYPGLFAAYNAGPERYARHLGKGVPLPAETMDYMAQLAPRTAYSLGPKANSPPGDDRPVLAAAGLFAVRRGAPYGAGEVLASPGEALFLFRANEPSETARR